MDLVCTQEFVQQWVTHFYLVGFSRGAELTEWVYTYRKGDRSVAHSCSVHKAGCLSPSSVHDRILKKGVLMP